MMSPDGTIGEIPADRVADAQAAGFKEMTDAEMAHLFNRAELERKFFEKRWKEGHPPIKRR
jgi:hypothetical protein